MEKKRNYASLYNGKIKKLHLFSSIIIKYKHK